MSETVTLTKEQFDALNKRLAAVETASTDAGVTVQTCNVCGDQVEGRCVKHPNDVTNIVGKDRFGKSVLVSQS